MTDDNSQRSIGRLEGRVDSMDKKLDALLATINANNENASTGRQRLYDRVGHLETSIEITGKIEAQMRDDIRSLDHKITNDVMPTINEVRRWKVAGVTVISMAGMAGAGIAWFATWAWDVIVSKWNGGP